MGNKLAAWKESALIEAVDKWWHETYPFNEANADNHPTGQRAYPRHIPVLKLGDLYQSYYMRTVAPNMAAFRLSQEEFAKCLMAAKIMDIGGKWRQATEWEPTEDQIRRVTG